jgi:hypothetical protein
MSGDLELADETLVAASPCAPLSATPERIFEGTIDRVLITESSLVVANFYGEVGKVAHVSKTDCNIKQAYSGPPISGAAVAGGVLYVIGSDSVSGYSALLAVSQAGEVKPVALAELFGGRPVNLGWLAASGNSAYVTAVAVQSDSSYAAPALVEIPCCGAAPRIVAEGLSEWANLSGRDAVVDGQTLVVGGENHVLDVGPVGSLAVFDLSTRQARVFFDTFQGMMNPFALEAGRLYLVRGSSIVSMGISDCSVAVVAERPEAEGITALAVDGGDVFWAESYDGLIGTRLFVKRADGTEARLAQVSGRVTWIGLDSQAVYWVMARDPTITRVLTRRRRL